MSGDPRRFFISTYFAIGRFGNSDDDLRYQDIIEGNIFEMPDKVIEVLRAKYLVSPIRYEGLQRIEELEYPEDSLREAILNAVVHKDYTGVNHKSRYFCYALLETGLFRSLKLSSL